MPNNPIKMKECQNCVFIDTLITAGCRLPGEMLEVFVSNVLNYDRLRRTKSYILTHFII